MTLEELYQKRCQTPSSINLHLPMLRAYAEQCATVVELGVDTGQSTTAFLVAQPVELVSYDVNRRPELDLLIHFGTDFEVDEFSRGFSTKIGKTFWDFFIMDSLSSSFNADLLFIDTWHSYHLLRQELALHHERVTKFILIHDIVSFGSIAEGAGDHPDWPEEWKRGLLPAIDEFLYLHSEWRERERSTIQSGLMVLERI